LNIFNAEKSVGDDVKKPITSSFFEQNHISFTWHLDVEHFTK